MTSSARIERRSCDECAGDGMCFAVACVHAEMMVHLGGFQPRAERVAALEQAAWGIVVEQYRRWGHFVACGCTVPAQLWDAHFGEGA